MKAEERISQDSDPLSEAATKRVQEAEYELPLPEAEDDGYEVIPLGALKAGEQPFCAWSASRLRVIRDEKKIILKVPIKSVGLAEVMDEIGRNAPVPPRRLEMIKKDSAIGKALGLIRDRVLEVENQLDPDYLKRKNDYDIKATYRLVLSGLAIDVLKEDGTYAVKANNEHSATQVLDEDAAVTILKQSGLTGMHLQQLASDIQKLTLREQRDLDRG